MAKALTALGALPLLTSKTDTESLSGFTTQSWRSLLVNAIGVELVGFAHSGCAAIPIPKVVSIKAHISGFLPSRIKLPPSQRRASLLDLPAFP